MEPPKQKLVHPVKYEEDTVIGMFAGHKTALIKTKEASGAYCALQKALKQFPSVKYIISAGICYAFNKEKHKIGDVIVSEAIQPITSVAFNDDGSISNADNIHSLDQNLQETFCQNLIFEDFSVSKCGRTAKVHKGTFLSYPAFMINEVTRDRFREVVPKAIGGEKEGNELLRLEKAKLIDGFIMIKSVVDYGGKDYLSGYDWHYVASLAAMTYARYKLFEKREFLLIMHHFT